MKSNTNHNPVIAIPCTSPEEIKEQKAIALVMANERFSCLGCYYLNDHNQCDPPIHRDCTESTIYKEISISTEQEKEQYDCPVAMPILGSKETVNISESPSTSDTQHDSVNKPKHYMLFPEKDIEVRDLMKVLAGQLDEEYWHGMLVSDYVQMMQYLLRWHRKNGLEDLEKAQWYLSKIIEQVKGTN